MTRHNDIIPEDEVWIKLGGDKGGGTFKMCFQPLNVMWPNSPENTLVFFPYLKLKIHIQSLYMFGEVYRGD